MSNTTSGDYGKWKYMVCGGGSILASDGGFCSQAAAEREARRALKRNVRADYAMVHPGLDDARWIKVHTNKGA